MTKQNNKLELYALILNDILTGKFQPGERLREQKLAQQYGTSRTPIREVIRLLENDNLLTVVPNAGAQLKIFTIKEIDELYLLRYHLELMIYTYIIENMNSELHTKISNLITILKAVDLTDTKLIAQANDLFNKTMLQLANFRIIDTYYAALTNLFAYLRNFTNYDVESKRRIEAVFEHIAICQTILAQDLVATEKLLTEHLENAKKHFINKYNFK
ncbi:GntR family transcriptional regulator [Spiroplasma eriocheiris]|uniref:GntR family transcriptional regulator n=1 Tax=Spiroplasma eriocheiris TaxID=315358 RepID=A0A0H3XHM5_9MOLU|nr:GntR family transcriptional regulator [Spiroplasma eriocheiris]AHF57768.1 putative transcriptional regulator [Spiroplasma eriocheiris CCTCC M 207170]AKM54218.1 GntR family transcriptional regulator [Spiroplasma eriocheiris]